MQSITTYQKRAIAKDYLNLIVHKAYLSDRQIMINIAEIEGVSLSTVRKIIGNATICADDDFDLTKMEVINE
jgi:hypothetical protein